MPQLAFNTLAKQATLTDLMQFENRLVEEIKALDGNIKTLVYDNLYSKFISATDTIKNVLHVDTDENQRGSNGIAAEQDGQETARDINQRANTADFLSP